MAFPGDASGKESTCQCRRHKRHGFDPRVGKIPWKRAWQPTLVFLSGESHGQKRLVQLHRELHMTEVTWHTQDVRYINLHLLFSLVLSNGSVWGLEFSIKYHLAKCHSFEMYIIKMHYFLGIVQF